MPRRDRNPPITNGDENIMKHEPPFHPTPSEDQQQLALQSFRRLRELAQRPHVPQRTGHSLGPTDLADEVWAALLAGGITPERLSPEDFVKLTQTKMNQILTDYARARNCRKRGGGWQREPLEAHYDALVQRSTTAFRARPSKICSLASTVCNRCMNAGIASFCYATWTASATRRLPLCWNSR